MSHAKAPFRVLFSNDTTNITTCVSPYHRRGETWQPEMLEATVDEVAGTGVDVHMIQLAHGQVPWYQSHVYPMQEHHRWWREYFGVDPMPDEFACDGVHKFILDGGDPLRVFIDRCRATGQAPFVSLRMNDVHHVENINTPGNVKGIHAISRFYAEHLHCRLGPDLGDWLQRTLDWTHDDVRDYMFSLIEEQCEGYDIAGLELDFMRFPSLFNPEKTTSEERLGIMVEFVQRARQVLDRTAAPGQRRWLCVRVPAHLAAHDQLGLDVPRWVEAGVEMVNLSYHYFTSQDGDLAAVRESAPDAAVYVEMCHATYNGPTVGERGKYDNFSYRRATPGQYYTTGHVAYARGLDGVSAFNFVYYREHGDGERGPFAEPPFHVFSHLRDPDWLAQQPQHYILNAISNTPRFDGRQLPKTLAPGQSATFRLDMAPPAGGWTEDGRLRIQSPEPLGGSQWRAALNGTELAESPDRSEPYGNPYTPLLGTPEQHRSWTVPQAAVQDGPNNLEIEIVSGHGEAKLVFIDLAIA